MARRFDSSDYEREARLTQQRDYAAQLQEQVRAKQAKAENEKSQRRQEQQRERELVDAQVQQAHTQQAHRPPAPPQQDTPQQQQQQPQTRVTSPTRSLQRTQQQLWHQQPPAELEASNGHAMLPSSPQKLLAGDPSSVSNAGGSYGTAYGGGGLTMPPPMLSPLVSTFMTGPSIFDSLLQSEASRNLTNPIELLQSLRLEVDASWKQRRAALQTMVSKPSFIIIPSPTASTSIPLSLDEKRVSIPAQCQLDQEIGLSNSLDDPREAELISHYVNSHTSGLVGESVLIPLPQISPAKCSSSPRQLVPSSPPRSNSAVHRRLAAATAAAANVMPSAALRHESELLRFDQ